MQTLKIVIYPQPILQKRAAEIQKIPSDIAKLISQMKITMQKSDGIGLAAPQINLSERLIIVRDLSDEKKSFAFINPKISKRSKKQSIEEEGCLSLPDLFIPVKRAEKIEVIARTPNHKKVHIAASGLAARIFQHEIDHINGKLIIDRISPWRRLKIRKQLKEFEKAQLPPKK